MNFIFDSCFFGTNNIYIQNNNTFILQERIPFNDVTEKMKSFFNTKKNQSFNSFSMNFNDIPNEVKDFQFLKKKSHGDIMTNYKENEENIEPQESSNKSSKYLNNFYKRRFNNINNINYSLNNLDEDNDENDNKENIELMNNNSPQNNTKAYAYLLLLSLTNYNFYSSRVDMEIITTIVDALKSSSSISMAVPSNNIY